MKTLLELDAVGLTASVGNQPILESISLCLQPGEFIALLGSSGAGKSSLFKLLNRLRDASSGTLVFQGRPIDQIGVCDLRRQIMLVGQEIRLLGMTAMDAIHYPLVLQKMPEAERQQRVNRCIDQLRIPQDWLEKTELELSGGQQQQIAIARALVTHPAILVLDEPTSALDLGAASRVLSVIQAYVREHGMSVVMSNHQIDLAKEFCDRVLYLEQGRLTQDKSASEVNWQVLKQTLIEADMKDREDWALDC